MATSPASLCLVLVCLSVLATWHAHVQCHAAEQGRHLASTRKQQADRKGYPQPQAYNAWVAGSNNCSCVRELTQLKKVRDSVP
jgi:hypothetical protein